MSVATEHRGRKSSKPPRDPDVGGGGRPDMAQIRIRKPAIDTAYELMDAYGLTRVVDVVGRALALWSYIHRRQSQGYTLLLRAPDGTLKEPELVFLD